MSVEAPAPITGIHHVTAIARDPQVNVDFYTGVLGLRLVKRTVNFDDPGTYHLYYGDGAGRPGSLITFFPWPRASGGRLGSGQVSATAFSIPSTSVGWWADRLRPQDVSLSSRFDEEVLTFRDPDGLALELVASATGDAREGWSEGGVPLEHSIRGLAVVAVTERAPEATLALLTETMGLRFLAEAGDRLRFAAGEGGLGATMDVLRAPASTSGRVAAGTVHHVAWRVADDGAQLAWQARLLAAGIDVTPVLDRQYFRSIYYREPGGTLFEIATDPPGFATDESVRALGSALKLPPWLERRRADIERALPRLSVPGAARV